MGGPLRSLLTALFIALVLAGAVSSAASANEAGLVVEHGDGSVTYVLIAFPEDEIASIDLLRRSGLSLATISSGGLGEAVCSIDSKGCGVSDCRARLCQTGDPSSPFWKFFRAGASDGWVLQPLGASATKVRGGEIDLWSWTGGEAEVPVVTLARVIELTNAPADRPADGVYIAWFDADGNQFTPVATDETDRSQLVAGAVLLVAVGGVAFALARRRRKAFESEGLPA